MKLGEEKKTALAAMIENIEMELFASEEPCVVTTTTTQEQHGFHQTKTAARNTLHPNCCSTSSSSSPHSRRHLKHPLLSDCEREPEPGDQAEVGTQPGPPSGEETELCAPVPAGSMEEIEIEMEVFPPFRVSNSELVQLLPNKVRRVRWRRLVPQRTGLVVKDVVCLPRELDLAQLERPIVPLGKDRAALVAMGMTARITIDYSWSANQMESRLAMLFRGKFERQTFSFVYLQCLQGSRALFVPDTPAGGWTGEQVIRVSGHGPLYIFSQQDAPQAECEKFANETPVANRKAFRREASPKSRHDGDSQQGQQMQPLVHRTTDQFPPDLDTALRLFRQENLNPDAETHIRVWRRELLRGAEQAVKRPGFCFRATPVISFSGEETRGHEGPLREFFRLTLLELQQSSVFEGRPGRLLFTDDLAALEDGKYYRAGVLIGWSLAQGGPGPRCLHPSLYRLMCGLGPSLDDFSLADIADAEVQHRLQQLKRCPDVKLLSPSLCAWVSSCGIPGISSAGSHQIPAIYMGLVKHYIYHRVARMISQFTEGMNSCGGLWDTVKSHWETFVPVMTSAQQEPLSLEDFKQLFHVCYSPVGSQPRAAEEATVGHWETVLTFIHNGQADFSFEDVLAFITGADHLPPLGFPRLISLQFYSQDGLPRASTCALELFLPRSVAGAVDLLVLLSRAVHEALGFTRLERDTCAELITGLGTGSPPENLVSC